MGLECASTTMGLELLAAIVSSRPSAKRWASSVFMRRRALDTVGKVVLLVDGVSKTLSQIMRSAAAGFSCKPLLEVAWGACRGKSTGKGSIALKRPTARCGS